MRSCGIRDEDITIICGYCSDVLKSRFKDTKINLRESTTIQPIFLLQFLLSIRSAGGQDTEVRVCV